MVDPGICTLNFPVAFIPCDVLGVVHGGPIRTLVTTFMSREYWKCQNKIMLVLHTGTPSKLFYGCQNVLMTDKWIAFSEFENLEHILSNARCTSFAVED